MGALGSDPDSIQYAESEGVFLGKQLTIDLLLLASEIDEGDDEWCEWQLGRHLKVDTCNGEVVSISSGSEFIMKGENMIGMNRNEMTRLLGDPPKVDFEEGGESWTYANLLWLDGDLQVTEADGLVIDVVQLGAG
jgi:hypothetical protein